MAIGSCIPKTEVFNPGSTWKNLHQLSTLVKELTDLKLTVKLMTTKIEDMSEEEKYSIACDYGKHQEHFLFKGIRGLEFIQDHGVSATNCALYAHAFPGTRSIELIETFCDKNELIKEEIEIIDYGAGLALWDRLFFENGFQIRSIDCKATIDSFILRDGWTFIRDVGKEVEYVEQNECGLPLDCKKKILFMCWPENPKDTIANPEYAERILREFRSRNGELAIYVGQPRGGITASDRFFDEIEAHWSATVLNESEGAVQSVPYYKNLDSLWLLKKKNSGFPFKIAVISITILATAYFYCIPKLIQESKFCKAGTMKFD